jgi:hypothetical protein
MTDETYYGLPEFKRDLVKLEELVGDQLPEALKALTWEEMEAGLIETGCTPEEAAHLVQVIRATGISPAMAVYCLAAFDG